MCRAVFLSIWLLAVMLFFHGLLVGNVGADGINLTGEITYQDINTTTTNKLSGEKIDTNTYLLRQQYNLDLSKTIYPYLRFDAGTIFDLDETTSKTEGTKTTIEERLLRPFLQLSLNNPIYQASLKYTQR